jgi:pSer/pThr/pTyr-binding forkhead associated (FHA) protein
MVEPPRRIDTWSSEETPQRPAQLMAGGARSRKLGPIGEHPLLIGRHEASDIVVQNPSVSRHHALIWRTHEAVLVRDLGSALGTRVGSRKLGSGDATEVSEGEDIVLADIVRLFWARGGAPARLPSPLAVVGGPMEDARGADRTAVWPTLAPGEPQEWAAVIADPGGTGRPLTVTVQCDDAGPREARIEDRDGKGTRVRGESRVVLMYILAGQVVRYQRGETSSAWVDDGDLAVGLWGRGARGGRRQAPRINTVLSRIRGQLRDEGLDESLIQKDGGRTRLRPEAALVVIEQGPFAAAALRDD